MEHVFTVNDLVSKMNASTSLRDQASSYMLGNDIHARDFVKLAAVAENGTTDYYGFQEQQLQAPVAESILEDGYAVQTNGSVQNSVNALQNHMTPVEEVVEEPQKHTYASIMQVAKGHSAPLAPREQSFKKSTSVSELNHVTESPAQAQQPAAN